MFILSFVHPDLFQYVCAAQNPAFTREISVTSCSSTPPLTPSSSRPPSISQQPLGCISETEACLDVETPGSVFDSLEAAPLPAVDTEIDVMMESMERRPSVPLDLVNSDMELVNPNELEVKKRPLAMSRSLPLCADPAQNDLKTAVGAHAPLTVGLSFGPPEQELQSRRSHKRLPTFHRHKEGSRQTLTVPDSEKSNAIDARSASKSESDLLDMVEEGKQKTAPDRANAARRGFVRRMSAKIRNSVPKFRAEDNAEEQSPLTSSQQRQLKHESIKFELIDLSMDDPPLHPAAKKMNYYNFASTPGMFGLIIGM